MREADRSNHERFHRLHLRQQQRVLLIAIRPHWPADRVAIGDRDIHRCALGTGRTTSGRHRHAIGPVISPGFLPDQNAI